MSTIEEVLKTLEAAEALLPSVKDTAFKEKQNILLIFGKEICQAYQAAGMSDPVVLEKLNKGSSAVLEAVLIHLKLEITSKAN
jgi:hypothetical protein